MAHLLSIVIPTKNRAMYCFSTIQSILNYGHALELVVQDSSDTDELESRVREISDPRLIYRRVSADLNMTENFDSALRLATGDYVLMLGDDDGITPQIFDAMEHCARADADCIASKSLYASYNWPDFRSKYSGDAQAGKLCINLDFDSSISEVSLPQEVDKFLRGAGQGSMGLPKIYHGLVSQRLIQQIRERHGVCFFGVSPDVSFSFMAGVHSRRHLVANYPLTIAGASGKSNAGRSALRTHKGELWDDPHMKNYHGEIWPKEVPEFFSVESVWSQASLAAVIREDRKYYDRFNFGRLYALMYLKHPDQTDRIKAAMKEISSSGERRFVELYLSTIFNVAVVGIATARQAAKSLIGRFFRPNTSVTNAINVFEASVLAKEILEGKK